MIAILTISPVTLSKIHWNNLDSSSPAMLITMMSLFPSFKIVSVITIDTIRSMFSAHCLQKLTGNLGVISTSTVTYPATFHTAAHWEHEDIPGWSSGRVASRDRAACQGRRYSRHSKHREPPDQWEPRTRWERRQLRSNLPLSGRCLASAGLRRQAAGRWTATIYRLTRPRRIRSSLVLPSWSALSVGNSDGEDYGW